jgi:hypothetical protein
MYLEHSGARDLQVLVELRVPSGDSRRALAQLADANHDGKIDDAEQKHMRRLLALRALDGVSIAAGTATVSIENVETKLRVDGELGPVDLAAHGVARLPMRARALTVTTSATGDPLDLVVLPGNRPPVETDRGTLQAGRMKASLGIGDRARIVLAETQK